jgi:ribonucleotide reductase alpha subunit
MKIKKITNGEDSPTWDLSVPREEHYITENGCVSHNSAILLGSFESFEPVTSNLFTRRVGQGEFLIVNKYLVNELLDLGLWDNNMIDKIIGNKGSVQNIMDIPEDIRYRYKDVWEIPQRVLLDLSIIRNKYVDQSQSLNVYHSDAK